MERGQEITIRGPYGNGFPVDTAFAGKDLLFIAGGIGLAPLHSVINYCRHYRSRYGKIDIVYGSRSMEDLVDYPEIENVWCKEDGINVHLTIDREQEGWRRARRLRAKLRQGARLYDRQDCRHVRPPDHDQVHARGTHGARLCAVSRCIRRWSCRMKCARRQMRPLQHRQQIRLQGRPGIPVAIELDELPDEY